MIKNDCVTNFDDRKLKFVLRTPYVRNDGETESYTIQRKHKTFHVSNDSSIFGTDSDGPFTTHSKSINNKCVDPFEGFITTHNMRYSEPSFGQLHIKDKNCNSCQSIILYKHDADEKYFETNIFINPQVYRGASFISYY